MFPAWLHELAVVSLLIGGVSACVIAADEVRREQRMWIMYLVWPLCALFGGLLWLWLYWRHGRGMPRGGGHEHQAGDTPMAVAVAKGASHCGAGCTLGDIVAEWLAFAVPGIAVALGWHGLFAEKTFAVWILDFALAFLLGIAFQYWTIKPMRDLSVGAGLVAAVKADTLSISSWQVGMYGAMAIGQFAILRPVYGAIAPVDSPEFWFVMQIAMLAGFATAYPVNWWLVDTGAKEKM
jgi:branched-subunit amino acid transport protein